MLSCKEVTQLCSRAMEEPLRLGERLSLRAHLLMCEGCSNYRRQLFRLRDAARVYAEGGAVTSDADAGLSAPDPAGPGGSENR